jgi:hypothetical protein
MPKRGSGADVALTRLPSGLVSVELPVMVFRRARFERRFEDRLDDDAGGFQAASQ